MSTKTENLDLIKPELTDAADITLTNENWDKIDTELGKISTFLPLTGGELTGELIVNDNFQVRKTFDEVPYRSYLRPINYSVASNGDYSTGLIHYKNGTTHAQLMFNKDGIMLRDNINEKAYQIYGQHNIDLLKNLFLSLNGGVLKGNLDFKKVENGSATIYKNHASTADYGLIIRDVANSGNYNQLVICAEEDSLKYRDTSGKISNISKIQKGTYVGTGKYGANNPNTLTFNFKPTLVMIFGTDLYGGLEPLCLVQGITDSYYGSSTNTDTHMTWEGNSVTWYTTFNAGTQRNEAHTYWYVAIG